MRYFRHLTSAQRDSLFFKAPERFERHAPAAVLAQALGATLYTPALTPRLAQFVRSHPHLVSSILCLEDSLGDYDLESAEANLEQELRNLAALSPEEQSELPILFLRIRTPEHLLRCAERFGETMGLVSGIVMPKFHPGVAQSFLRAVETVERNLGQDRRLFAMPILETTEVIRKETRIDVLCELRGVLAGQSDRILNIRFGVVDFSGLYGLRRAPGLTLYDVELLRDCVGDLVNVFGDASYPWVVSGGVSEHYCRADAPAEVRQATMRSLEREVELDKANGLWGKSVIHPDQLPIVQSCYVVSHEDFVDARDILDRSGTDNGAKASPYANKMNEAKPHRQWAQRTMIRASIFGVFNRGVTRGDLIGQ